MMEKAGRARRRAAPRPARSGSVRTRTVLTPRRPPFADDPPEGADMGSLRSFLSVCSFLLFVASYPELQGPLVIVLFFVAVGCMHYLLWGRAMSRAIRAEAAQGLEPADSTTEYTEYTEPVR